MAHQLLAAIPDNETEIDDIIGDGDTVVVRSTCRGTHNGELFGVALARFHYVAYAAGLLLMLLSQAVGVQMIAEGGNTFGAAGALKLPHALTLHAVQVLPALTSPTFDACGATGSFPRTSASGSRSTR